MKNQLTPISAMRNTVSSLQNILESSKFDREMKVNELISLFQTSYPRLKDNPEQKILLRQMCSLYIRLEYELIPMLDNYLDNGEIIKYKQLSGTVAKFYQQWDRLMTKLGFTYSSKPQVTAKERKNYDPKANEEIKDNVSALIGNLKLP